MDFTAVWTGAGAFMQFGFPPKEPIYARFYKVSLFPFPAPYYANRTLQYECVQREDSQHEQSVHNLAILKFFVGQQVLIRR
jgi:hypothetical protein